MEYTWGVHRKPVTLLRYVGVCSLAALFISVLAMPVAYGFGWVVNQAADTFNASASSVLGGLEPGLATITDSSGHTIATLYSQERTPVSFENISPNMVKAVLSIEDRRFMEHNGVDWKGTLRAFLTNANSGHVEQGASTLDQQYVKNYLLLVEATNDQQRSEATAENTSRKLREARLALLLEKSLFNKGKEQGLSDNEAHISAKKQIVTRYLNLVYFGNEIYGIERAAQYYFGIPAKNLSVAQSAMLAGMLQSTARFDPYAHPQAVLKRRNTVLSTMIANFPSSAAIFTAAQKEPLGVLKEPKHLRAGCGAAGGYGFFCDYVIQNLLKKGFNLTELEKHNAKIRTTLDHKVQVSALKQIQSIADPHLDSVAEVFDLIKSGTTSHDIMAMVSSRNYGLDEDKGQTQLPEPYSLVGDGAGSVFKIFTAAAALEKGMGTKAILSVPPFVKLAGMGDSGTPGCPATYYCVKNDGKYRNALPLTDALATSPNTAFVKLLHTVGVKPAVDMAVKLGLRSYAEPGTFVDGSKSLAEGIKEENLGSFTLGPFAINNLELSNVAATLSSHGVWCEPNPLLDVSEPELDNFGAVKLDHNNQSHYKSLALPKNQCEQVVDPGLADTLSNALSKDSVGVGTSAASAARAGWTLPVSAKTGTTETHRSSAFLGYTNRYAGAVYVFGDTHPQPICSSPLRPCYEGNVYGGMEPAYTWYSIMAPLATEWGPISLPKPVERYVNGSDEGVVPSIAGLSQGDAISKLTGSGFKYDIDSVNSTAKAGTVLGSDPSGSTVPGGTITILTSNGIPPAPVFPKHWPHGHDPRRGHQPRGNPRGGPPGHRGPR